MATKGKRQRERERRQRRAERRANTARTASPGAPAATASSTAEPVRGVEADTIDPSLCWHIARTRPRMGDRALKALEHIKVTTYQPRASEIVVRRGRRVVRHTPLLIRTVLIGVRDADHLGDVAALPGISEIVSYPEVDPNASGNIIGPVLKPARLDPASLQRFMDALAKGEIIQPVGIKVGQSVVVLTGPFASFPAIVEDILPHDRIKVGVSIFGRASPVELGIAEVQPV